MSRSLRKSLPGNLIFPLAQVAIPYGYTSETFGYALKNVANNSTNPGTTHTGTHQHNISAVHSHPAKSVTHKHSYCTTSHGLLSPPAFDVAANTGTATISVGLHKHSGYTDDTATTVPQSATSNPHQHDTGTFDPQWYAYTHIKKNSIVSLRQSNKVPFNAIVFASSSSLFPGYTLDIAGQGKLVGEGTFGTTNGSTTHTHTTTDCVGSHIHTADMPSHTHAVGGTTGNESVNNSTSEQGSVARTPTHTHTVSGTTAATTDVVTFATGGSHIEAAVTHLPENITLGAAKHTSVGLRDLGVPKNGVVEWRCTLASIPTGFGLTDGSGGRFNYLGKAIKIAANTGEIAGTSGSTSHQHPAQTHTHVINTDGHLHAASITSSVVTTPTSPGVSTGSYASNIQTSHTHTITTANSDVFYGACNTSGFSTTSSCGTHQHAASIGFGRAIDVALIQKT